MWIFGYGSLMWKVDFPYEEKKLGYIRGYARRFYQYSTDHRGTPQNPGRVVTLIPAGEGFCVYGVAYRIHKADVEKVLAHLDYREKGGYERKSVVFHPFNEEEQPFKITLYLGDHDNIHYAGPAEISVIAEQVYRSVGPSGTNSEYVLKLANAMKTFFPHIEDDHLFSLEKELKNLINQNSFEQNSYHNGYEIQYL